jgi:hypothetical protein
MLALDCYHNDYAEFRLCCVIRGKNCAHIPEFFAVHAKKVKSRVFLKLLNEKQDFKKSPDTDTLLVLCIFRLR